MKLQREFTEISLNFQLLKLTDKCLHATGKLGRVGRNIIYVGTSYVSHRALSLLEPSQERACGTLAGTVPKPTKLPFVT